MSLNRLRSRLKVLEEIVAAQPQRHYDAELEDLARMRLTEEERDILDQQASLIHTEKHDLYNQVWAKWATNYEMLVRETGLPVYVKSAVELCWL